MSGTTEKLEKIFFTKWRLPKEKKNFCTTFLDILRFFKNSKNENLGMAVVPDIDKSLKKTLLKFQVNRFGRT